MIWRRFFAPLHFVVPSPHHFHMREDFLEELCAAEAYTTLLPRNENYYERWLRYAGRTAEELPFDYVASLAKGRYRLTARYILTVEIVPGTRHRTNFVIDEQGLPQWMQPRVLFLFVIERAIAFCGLKGMNESHARQKFLPAYPAVAPPTRTESEWAIGLERETGFCTILPRGAETEIRFLSSCAPWRTPFPEDDAES